MTALCVVIRLFASPVLFLWSIDDSIRPEMKAIMNPFRDRGPEKVAEKYLTLLKSGNIDSVKEHLGANKDNIIEEEPRYPIRNWHLSERSDSGNTSLLTY